MTRPPTVIIVLFTASHMAAVEEGGAGDSQRPTSSSVLGPEQAGHGGSNCNAVTIKTCHNRLP